MLDVAIFSPRFPFDGIVPRKKRCWYYRIFGFKSQCWRTKTNSVDMLASQHISTTDNGIIHAINREERLSIMEMKKIAFFDTKPYDRESFDRLNNGRYDIKYFETRLTLAALPLADGCDAACAFVNAEIDRAVVEGLVKRGIKVLAMRCAGYNNVDFKAAYEAGLTVVRVPAYSPYAVAEHAAALLMTLTRHIHRAAVRTKDFNFSLVGLTGFDLHGKTTGECESSPTTHSRIRRRGLNMSRSTGFSPSRISSRCIVRFSPKRSTSSTPTRSPRQSAASRSSTPRAAGLSIRRRCSRHCATARSAQPGWTCTKRKANGSTRIVRTLRGRTRR